MMLIDQAGLPPGVPGRARTDGKPDGSLVTLTNTGASFTTAFRLLWVPPLDVAAIASLAATADPKIWTFTPSPGCHGTYLVEMVENEGRTTEKRERRAFVVRTPSLGLVVPAFGERGGDNNADPDPDGPPTAGWWRAMARLIAAVDGLFTIPIRVTWHHRNGAGALTVRTYPSFAAAFAVDYPTLFDSTAVHDIAPTFGPDDPGPYVVDGLVHYVLRSTAGRDAVRLPELILPDGRLTLEGCSIVLPITGIGSGGASELSLRDCSLAAGLANIEALTARECSIGGSITLGTASPGAAFDRCVFAPGATITSNSASGGVIAFIDCAFTGSIGPEIEFTDGAGVVRMDARSKFLWDGAGGTLTNGTIVLEAPP